MCYSLDKICPVDWMCYSLDKIWLVDWAKVRGSWFSMFLGLLVNKWRRTANWINRTDFISLFHYKNCLHAKKKLGYSVPPLQEINSVAINAIIILKLEKRNRMIEFLLQRRIFACKALHFYRLRKPERSLVHYHNQFWHFSSLRWKFSKRDDVMVYWRVENTLVHCRKNAERVRDG